MKINQQLIVLASFCIVLVLSCGRESLEMSRKEHSTLQSSSETEHLLRLSTTSENPDVYRVETCLITEEGLVSESSCINAFYGSDQEEITFTLSETNSDKIHASGAFIFPEHFSAGRMKYQEDLFSGLKKRDPKTMGAVGGGVLETTLVIGLEKDLSVALAEARHKLKSTKSAQHLLVQKQANIRSEIRRLEENREVLEVKSQGEDVLTQIDDLVQELAMETRGAGLVSLKEILYSIGFGSLEDAQKHLEIKRLEDAMIHQDKIKPM